MKFFDNAQYRFCECSIDSMIKMDFGLSMIPGLRKAQAVIAAVMLLGFSTFSYANTEVEVGVYPANITRTAWEMIRSDNVITLGFNLTSRDDVAAYDFVESPLPLLDDTRWQLTPDQEIIGFAEVSRLNGTDGNNGCKSAVDYSYFQTVVNVPYGVEVSEFNINFSGIDDDARVSIYNSKHQGLLIPGGFDGSDISLNNDGYVHLDDHNQYPLGQDINLLSYVASGENRIVVTQVDNCPSTSLGNLLQSAVVSVDGIEVITADAFILQAVTSTNSSEGAVIRARVSGGSGEPIPSTIQILTSTTCVAGVLGNDAYVYDELEIGVNTDNVLGGTLLDENGEAFLIGSVSGNNPLDYPMLRYAAVQVISESGFEGNTSSCIVAGPENDSWVRAADATGNLNSDTPIAPGYIDNLGNSRWFKFTIEPGSRATIDLSALPEDYDIAVFRDIQQAFDKLVQEVSNVDDLNRMGAEFAPSMYSPSMYSPSMYSPSMYSPSMYSPSMYSPSMYSPSMYSPSMYSPSMYSPSMYSPSMYSPSMYSPSMYSPDVYNEKNYTSAQLSSLIRVSAQLGTVRERVIADTWNNTGYFYVRVTGKNGVFNTESPFQLSVSLDGGLCDGVAPITSGEITVSNGGFNSVILLDSLQLLSSGMSQLGIDPSEAEIQQLKDDIAALKERLETLKIHPEVKGDVFDLAVLGHIQLLHEQADTNSSCPYAANLTAQAIKEVIDTYRDAGNPLSYVVLAGSDAEIPFFRYPDQGQLGPEQNYEPPMSDGTQSQASLRLNYVLGQDEYGASITLSLNETRFPVPELAVGRLVETPREMIEVINAYLNFTTNGVVAAPDSTLVTGYDFLTDAAGAVHTLLDNGTVSSTPNHSLINDDWTAGDLIDSIKLLDRGTDDHGNDIVFLAGHFSANSALAADYQTSVLVNEVAELNVDMKNTLVFSAGCHSGYNIVNSEIIKGLTQPLDWTQVFASKGATLIAGTGYQYGDTDFIEYSERLYVQFATELRTGDNPVSVGEALVKAKQHYLSHTPDIRGLHRKSILISTLFGLPMLKIGLPENPITNDYGDPKIASPVQSGPGAPFPDGLGLSTRSLNLVSADLYAFDSNGNIDERSVPLDRLNDDNTVSPGALTAKYLVGPDWILTNPGEPAIPLKTVNVSAVDSNQSALSLRGVGFLGGKYTEDDNIVPFTGAPSTELRGVHIPFASTANFPMRLAIPNFYGAIAQTGGVTNLHVTPVQHRDEDISNAEATRRQFTNMDFKLFYSNNTESYTQVTGDGTNKPSLVAPPSMSGIRAVADIDGNVVFSAFVDGALAAGIQSVWVTYTISGALYPEWKPIYLIQDQQDSRLWTAVHDAGTEDISHLNFIVQAVNGTGRVSADDNFGLYYKLQSIGGEPTYLTLSSDGLPPLQYGSTLDGSYFQATLKNDAGESIDGMPIFFTVGDSTRMVKTVGGIASVDIPLIMTPPGNHYVTAYFPGIDNGAVKLQPAAATLSNELTVSKADTFVQLTGPDRFYVDQNVSGFVATLTDKDVNGTPLVERTVYFSITAPDGSLIKTVAVITNLLGEAILNIPPVEISGLYTVTARFLGSIPTQDEVHEVNSPLYFYSSALQTFSADLVPTELSVSAATTNVYTNLPITSFGITASLKDSVKGLNLSGHVVTFTIGGHSFTAVTNSSGVAKLDAQALPADAQDTTLAAGANYLVSASFAGDGTYAATGSLNDPSIQVDWVPTELTVSVATNNVYTDLPITSYGITASLKDSDINQVLSGHVVTFSIGGVSFTAITNSSGVAKLDAQALPADAQGTTLAAGVNYLVSASFAGDDTYAAADSLNQPSIQVDWVPTQLTVFTVVNNVYTDLPVTSYGITASLKDSDKNQALSGHVVTFSIGSVSFTAITDSLGVARLDAQALPADALGTTLPAGADYVVSASFAGNDIYESTDSINQPLIQVSLVPTDLSVVTVSQVTGVDGIDVVFSATLLNRSNSQPVSGRAITFSIGGKSYVVDTVNGVATLQTSLALPGGNYVVTADFYTDDTFSASQATTSLDLIRGMNCPSSNVKGKQSILGFCYLVHEVDGKVAITNGTLIVGEGGYVDQKVEQFGDGSIIINSLASIRGMIVETGPGDVVITGIAGDSKVGGQIDESGSGDVIINAGGIVYGNISEENDGSVFVRADVDAAGTVIDYGTVEGNIFESGVGSIFIEAGAVVTGGLQED